MHEVLYAGQRLLTTESLAEAVLEYAMYLAATGANDAVTIPLVHEGVAATSRLLVGAGIPIAIVAVSGHTAQLPGADEAWLDIQTRLLSMRAATD